MGKIWLKSVDPNRQCCGCEGKSGPCDSCCLRTTVPKETSSIIFDNPLDKSVERYYYDKIYSTSSDSWEITDKNISFNINSSENPTQRHSNILSLSLDKDQEISIDLNFILSYLNYPSSLVYGATSTFRLSYGVFLSSRFNISIDVNHDDFEGRIEVLTNLNNQTQPFLNADKTTNLTTDVSSENSTIFSFDNIISNRFFEGFCLKRFVSQYGASFEQFETQAALDAEFQRSEILVDRVSYKATWTTNGNLFNVVFNNPSTTSCEVASTLLDSPPTLNGVEVAYFIGGYNIVNTGSEVEIPIPTPNGFSYTAEVITYLVVYNRPIDFLSGETNKNYSIRIKAIKNCCLSINMLGSYQTSVLDYPNSREIQSMSGTITSNKKINILKLDFPE